MTDTNYAYATTAIRVKEATLLSPADIERLMEANSVEAAWTYLISHGWDLADEKKESSSNLRNELEAIWSYLTEISPDISILYPLILRKDFHNLKAGMKSSLAGFDVDEYFISPCTVSHDLIKEAVTKRSYDLLPKALAEVGEDAYDVLSRTGDGQLADIMIDRAALDEILLLAKATRNDFMIKIQELFCAAANIKTAYRATKMSKGREFFSKAISTCDSLDRDKLISAALTGESALLSYLEHTAYEEGVKDLESSPASFEKWCDDKIVEYTLDAKYLTFGPEPMIAFYLAKEAEIKNVRIIISAIENGLPYDKVCDRLRRLYA